MYTHSTTTTTTTHRRGQSHSVKPQTRISSSVSNRKLEPPTIVSPDNSWFCSPSPPPQPRRSLPTSSPSDSPSSSFGIRLSPVGQSPVMDFAPSPTSILNGHGNGSDSFPSSFSKFNSALTAGLLNPMSPPPPSDKTRSSPTLFEMMASEPDTNPRAQIQSNTLTSSAQRTYISAQDMQALTMQRISDILAIRSPGTQFNDSDSSDIKLTMSSKNGISVSVSVHRQILVAQSRFFAVKLSDLWTKQQRLSPYIVEIADCDDVEIYIETLRLMYCKDLRKKLMKDDVSRVLGILKVSAAIGFDAGVLSCLEYLEASPWAEDEEEKVASLLSELRLETAGAGEVLKRVSIEVPNGPEGGNDNEEVLLKLLHVVLEGKDKKAKQEMKALVSKMLHDSSAHNELRKESLYSACDGCLQLLCHHFLQAAASDMQDVGQIARQADNLYWILDILIDMQIADDFLKTWASQSELSEVHFKVPAVHRFVVSQVTARLFVGIGKGQLLASKDVRCLLLQTWLVPFYNDFGWMRRATKGLDRHLIEDGLSNTILTLPLSWQQEIFLAWVERFLNSGDDCPNIQRGFEVWWRRAFWRRNDEKEKPRQLRITTDAVENS